MSREDHSTSAAPVRERYEGTVPALVHPGWEKTFPWLVQGTTVRGAQGQDFDLGLFADASPEQSVRANWRGLVQRAGMRWAVHARQLHGSTVRWHEDVEGAPEAWPMICEPCDGHATDRPGCLLAVATADCVPVFVVAPERRAVAVVHAGWRGTAAGVLERGLEVMAERFGAPVVGLHVHFGPSICGACYEVGPEVFGALGRPEPRDPTPIDLRAVLAERAAAAGVPSAQSTVSEHCTRCTGSGLFSHRGGDGARQVGYLGIKS